MTRIASHRSLAERVTYYAVAPGAIPNYGIYVARRSRLVPRLIVTRGVDEGKQFDLTGETVTIGRHSSNAVALHDTQVSRRHLEVRSEQGGGYWLVDLGSGNGTLLNGHAIQEAPLRSGDTITLGQSVLIYTAGRTDHTSGNELTERVKFHHAPVAETISGVVRTVSPDIGSQILSRPAAAGNEWLRTRLASLAALYETADAVSHILDVDELLARVMQLVLKSVDADHGGLHAPRRGGPPRSQGRPLPRRGEPDRGTRGQPHGG